MSNNDTSSFRQIHKVETKEKKKIHFTRKTIIMIVIVAVLVVAMGTTYFLTTKKDSYSTTVTNGSSGIISGDVSITKQGYFEYLLETSGAQKTVDDAYDDIANKLITDSKYKSQIEAKVKEKENLYKTYGQSVKAYAASMGYDNVETFRKEVVIPEVKQDLLRQKYFSDNYSKVTQQYKVAYLKAITVSKESEAIKLIKKATSAQSFDQLMKEHKDNATDYKLVTTKTNTSTLNKKIKAKLSSFSQQKTDGVYPTAIKQSSNKYVVIYVYNTNKTQHKSTIISDLSALSDLNEDIKVYYLNHYQFTVYDKKLKKEIEKINKKYINK